MRMRPKSCFDTTWSTLLTLTEVPLDFTDLFAGVDPLAEDDGAVGAVAQLLERDVSVHHRTSGVGLSRR